MTITFGGKFGSLKAQTNLSKTSNELSNVYERLSSGLRINKASDDAAGLAIGESLRSDRKVYVKRLLTHSKEAVQIQGPYLPADSPAVILTFKVTYDANFDKVYDHIKRRIETHPLHSDRARYMLSALLDSGNDLAVPIELLSAVGVPYLWSSEELRDAENALSADEILRKKQEQELARKTIHPQGSGPGILEEVEGARNIDLYNANGPKHSFHALAELVVSSLDKDPDADIIDPEDELLKQQARQVYEISDLKIEEPATKSVERYPLDPEFAIGEPFESRPAKPERTEAGKIALEALRKIGRYL